VVKLKVLVDTNIIIEKRNKLFNLLGSYDPIYSDLVLAEVMEVIRKNALEFLKKNKREGRFRAPLRFLFVSIE